MSGDACRAPRLADTAAAWAGTRRVEADGRLVRYREAGSGPALVLVHGLGVSADYWHRNAPSLAAAGLRVLAPDLPGFGRTEGPRDGLPILAQAAAVRGWAAAMGLGPAVYVGHSLSCQSVLELAAHEPALVRALVLQAPTGAPGRHRLLRQLAGFVADVPLEDWRLIPVVAQAYVRAGPVRFWRTWQQGTAHEVLPVLPRVRAPSLVVVGRRDPVVDRGFVEALARGLPGPGEVAWIEGAAHAAHFKRPEDFNRVVVEFVRGLPAG